MNLHGIGEKITAEDISNLEDKLGISLSLDYKEFLLKNNGGYLDDFLCTNTFTETDPESNKTFSQSTNVDKFYSLEEVLEEYEENLDDPIIPEKFAGIAYDSNGNQILLCADDSENNGKIYFANHELYDPETDYWVLSVIADSFTEFLNSLHEFDE